ncbi:unnamed protein product [Lampetra fluviatilis]
MGCVAEIPPVTSLAKRGRGGHGERRTRREARGAAGWSLGGETGTRRGDDAGESRGELLRREEGGRVPVTGRVGARPARAPTEPGPC